MRMGVKGFSIFKESLFYKKEGDSKRHWISNALWVQAETKDHQGCGRLLAFMNNRKEKVEVWMPFSYFSGNGKKALAQLMKQGFVYSNTFADRNALLRYIIQSPVSRLMERVSKPGWYKEAYVLPPKIFGKTNPEFFCTAPSFHQTQGTLQEWQDHVARYCVGNSRLILGVCAAFASSVLKIFSYKNVGFHLVGSCGKTTWLKVAGSVFGTPCQRGRVTDHALESMARTHNDSLLLLDEIESVNPRRMRAMMDRLANGRGMGQSIQKWRLLFLSTGEVDLENLMKHAHQNRRYFPIPTEKEGIFENLHNFSSQAELAKHLSHSAECYCGTAIESFLEKITQNPDDLISYGAHLSRFLKASYSSLSASYLPVLETFILLAVVGEYARFVTGWPSGKATKGCMACFEGWRETFTSHEREEKKIMEYFQNFFKEHGESRFQDFRFLDSPLPSIMGYKDPKFYYIRPSIFKKVLCKDFDEGKVLEVLKKKDSLKCQGNRFTHLKKIRGKPLRFYTFIREKVHHLESK